MEIDWLSAASHVLLNPRMPDQERQRLESFVVDLPGHVWLSTSGTTGALKVTALSKRALLASAAAVNRHLQSDANDVWLCVLPTFHVGGLGIYARAFLSGARVVDGGWDGVTLASLVPAQVSDLVHDGIPAPRSLRAVVVGGGALSEEIDRAARALGWPLLPSYGMTECCSQVATATLESRELVLLDHVEARIESDGRLALRSEALLTGYASEAGFVDPKVDGWFITEDLAALDGRVLRVEGRRGDFVKIGGESVDLSRLDRILEELGADAAVFAIPDERLGHVIGLAVASADPETIAAAFNARVFPFERVRRIVRVAEIPRTALGKVMRARLP
ncbi:MAG: AMP-binding protein [Thermoanaerobaculia bacterium]